MAYNEELNLRIRAALAHLPRVEEKKMFRGVTFMVNGKMCISAGDNTIMCRIDPELHETALGKKGCRSVKMKGREYRGFVYIDGAGMETKRQLEDWVGLALAFNKNARASKKRKKG
jgi:TfoX/Sxy family transcriptional regulator of competence genes